MTTGLLLLSGGRGTRMGAPKHELRHPAGGSWSGHLLRVFRSLCPEGPVWILGEPIPEHPDLPRLDDERQGPAAALRAWCRLPVPDVDRWWVVGCDQVRWTSARLASWIERADTVDPGAEAWILARQEGHLQPLGGFLPSRWRALIAERTETSLLRLVEPVPHRILDVTGPEWRDVDTPEERLAFEGEP